MLEHTNTKLPCLAWRGEPEDELAHHLEGQQVCAFLCGIEKTMERFGYMRFEIHVARHFSHQTPNETPRATLPTE